MPNGRDEMTQIETQITEKQIICYSVSQRISTIEQIIEKLDIEKAELCFDVNNKLFSLEQTKEYLYSELEATVQDTARLVEKYFDAGNRLELKE